MSEHIFTDKEMFRALFDGANITYQVSKNGLHVFHYQSDHVLGSGSLGLYFNDDDSLKEMEIWE